MTDPISLAFALAQFAPTIIKWISGSDKAADAAGKVVEIAEAVTGRSGNDAFDALAGDPSLVLQFRQAVMAQEVELDKAYLADRADARARDIEFLKAGRHNVRADIMVGGVLVALVCCLATMALFRESMPGEVAGIMGTLVGIFGKCLSDAFQYEFGSSRGSAEKSALMNLK